MQFLLHKFNHAQLIVVTLLAITLLPSESFASIENFSSKASYQVCFTPEQECTDMIVDAINHAQKSIYVQAYSFTSAPIASALLEGKNRGLDIKVILDKSQIKNNKYSSAKFLMNNGIPTWIDYRVAIAHSKVIIIDESELITGSFNFTKAAQLRNAENLVIINDNDLAKKYLDNWLARKAKSLPAEEYLQSKQCKVRERNVKT